MYLRSLGLEHFRCYEALEIALGPGLHVFWGPNAGGKTSLLEAIHLLALTRSQRTASDRALIAWGAQWARVSGLFATSDRRDLSLRVTLRHKHEREADDTPAPRKIVEVNAVPRRRLSDIIGQATVVFFGPDDVALIKGPPALRRHFVNAALSQMDPVYLADLMRYRQALRQRNECLRSVAAGKASRELVAAWDHHLVESGARIAGKRAGFVEALGPHLRRLHWDLTEGAEEVRLSYAGDLAEAMDLDARRALMQRLLAESVERDLAAGRTIRGPHRDELEVLVGGVSLRSYGSQGQQRTAALGLTLAEAFVIAERSEEAPIVLLDDCLSELDEGRARRILALTDCFEQMLVTTASWSPLLQERAATARVLTVGGGRVTEGAPGGET